MPRQFIRAHHSHYLLQSAITISSSFTLVPVILSNLLLWLFYTSDCQSLPETYIKIYLSLSFFLHPSYTEASHAEPLITDNSENISDQIVAYASNPRSIAAGPRRCRFNLLIIQSTRVMLEIKNMKMTMIEASVKVRRFVPVNIQNQRKRHPLVFPLPEPEIFREIITGKVHSINSLPQLS